VPYKKVISVKTNMDNILSSWDYKIIHILWEQCKIYMRQDTKTRTLHVCSNM